MPPECADRLARCRVVLVRTRVAGNIGSAARAMRNFGLTELVLVAPEADPLDPEARKRSTQGEAILQAARVVPDLESALGGCVLVAGTSARTGGPCRRQSVAAPDRVLPLLAAAPGPTALVFGPEANGLSDDEVTRCHHLVRIPTGPEYPALNLAHAVVICAYELFRACQEGGPASEGPAVAAFAEQELLFARLQAALEAIHFLYGDNARSLMHALRHLIGRAQPSTMEVKLLLGLARQIQWFARRHPP